MKEYFAENPLALPLIVWGLAQLGSLLWKLWDRLFGKKDAKAKADKEALEKALAAERAWKEECEADRAELHRELTRMHDLYKEALKAVADVQKDMTQRGLVTDKDFAHVGEIMKKMLGVNDLMTTMVEQQKWHKESLNRHDEEFKTVHDRLREIDKDIKDLLRDAKSS